MTLTYNTPNANFGSNALQFFHNSGGAQTYGDLQSNNLAVAAYTNYILRFRGYASAFTALNHRLSQANSPYATISASVAQALDGTARDYYWLTTATQNEAVARLIFTLNNAPATVFLDDMSLYAYSSIAYDDPSVRSPIFVNPTDNPQTFTLSGNYRDLDNNLVTGSITVPAWSSRILVKSDAALPVELLNFHGNTEGSKNVLQWQTASENGTQYFDIQRLTVNNAFENIGQLKAVGKPSTYDFTDKSPLWGLGANHYRLKIVDVGGTIEFSKTISLENGEILRGLKIYPNPVSNILTIETDAFLRHEANSDFQIFNFMGQSILKGKISAGRIDVLALPRGSYILKIGLEQVKFIKP